MVKPCFILDIISLGIHCNTNFILKFVRTGGSVLLENAVLHLQKVLSTEEDDRKEQYMNSLVCTKQCNGSHLKLHLLQSIFVSISMWCDYKLQDYHSHFSQVSCKPSVTLLYHFGRWIAGLESIFFLSLQIFTPSQFQSS
jgi:hypothetical protein